MDSYANLQTISQENALNLAQFFIRSGNNFLLFGRSGVGKTEIILQAIKECKLKVNYINLSVMERCDLGGYPDINSGSNIITFKYPHFLPRLEEGSKPDTVWLFDEVDKCSPETTAPLLEILQFRKINGVQLNIVACALTSNLINENAYSNRISSALIDRTAKYILEFDFNLWIDWAKANNVHDLIIGFLRSDPQFACASIEDTAYASPSPRSWTWASQALVKSKELKIPDIESVTQIISGYVGSEAGLRFKLWYEFYRKFEPFVHSLIERGQMSLNFDDLVPTEKIVFVIAACYHAKLKVFADKSKNRFIYLEHLCNFFNQYKVETEMQVMGLHNSFDFEMIKTYKLYQCKLFFDLFTRLSEGVTFKK
jgi:AAA domain (dynein-related subfamily)